MIVFATCSCGREVRAEEKFAQADRHSYQEFLGWSGYCSDCQVYVPGR